MADADKKSALQEAAADLYQSRGASSASATVNQSVDAAKAGVDRVRQRVMGQEVKVGSA